MNEILTGQATPAQIGAYLVALQFEPVPPSILVASANTLRSFAKRVSLLS